MNSSAASAPDAGPNLNLSNEPEAILLPPTHLVYLEKIGPFKQTAPLAWREFWAIAGGQLDQSQITRMVGLSRMDPTKQGDAAYVYQAGVLFSAPPGALPKGLQSRLMPAGKYARYLLRGSYTQLAAAYPAAFSRLAKAGLQLRDDFCIEKYLNAPPTPEPELKTKILIPIA